MFFLGLHAKLISVFLVSRYIDIVAGLAINEQGHIVAVDSVSPTVFRITENGELIKWFDVSDRMREPSDLAIHGKEYYICDFKVRIDFKVKKRLEVVNVGLNLGSLRGGVQRRGRLRSSNRMRVHHQFPQWDRYIGCW